MNIDHNMHNVMDVYLKKISLHLENYHVNQDIYVPYKIKDRKTLIHFIHNVYLVQIQNHTHLNIIVIMI